MNIRKLMLFTIGIVPVGLAPGQGLAGPIPCASDVSKQEIMPEEVE